MKYDYDKYINCKLDIVCFMRNRPHEDPVDLLGILAYYTSCPIVVVCYYVEQMYGPSEKLTQRKKNLMKYYKVEEE